MDKLKPIQAAVLCVLFVRIGPKTGPEKFFRCGIEFSRDWQRVDVDKATANRLHAEQMLEVTDTQPEGYEALPEPETPPAPPQAPPQAKAKPQKPEAPSAPQEPLQGPVPEVGTSVATDAPEAPAPNDADGTGVDDSAAAIAKAAASTKNGKQK